MLRRTNVTELPESVTEHRDRKRDTRARALLKQGCHAVTVRDTYRDVTVYERDSDRPPEGGSVTVTQPPIGSYDKKRFGLWLAMQPAEKATKP